MGRIRTTEVDAYTFIKEYLGIQGWVVKNPNRAPNGQVYTQNECLDHPEIKRFLGQAHPENIVKVSETEFYVIEAKRNKKQIEQAIEEAKVDYAEKINQSRSIKVRIISGVAGNSTDGFIVKSRYFKNGKFAPIKINGKEITGFVSPQIARELLENDTPEIDDLPVDEATFLRTAEGINKILHLGAINKNYRARVMATILLSIVDDTRPNVDATPRILINDINSRAENVLIRNKKQEFSDCIKIALPPSQDNHIKFKKALVQTLQELENLNIRSAMNSGADVLGKFYEVFLKYGNGAKEIGIVLTPRHITKFAAEVVDVNTNDIVYDPTCGTSGFLVAAFDQAKKNAEQNSIEYFKNNGLYGIEQEPEVAALAIVNMIFRGDGKNNIIEGNCFQKSLVAKNNQGKLSGKFYGNNELPTVRSPAATKVLMNPPFALKKSDEKEYRFIEHALEQMKGGGLLFSVLPYSLMVKPDEYLEWRKRLLENNTLLSVITFPIDLFYPIGVHTVGVFIKKGVAHSTKQPVLWIRALNDGFLKSKGKRLPSCRAKDDFIIILPILKRFVQNQNIKVENVNKFLKVCPIDFSDNLLELVAENYLDEEPPKIDEIQENVEQIVRDMAAYLIRTRKE